MYQGLSIGVVIPALNEAPAIAKVIAGLLAQKTSLGNALIDEIAVCDNGSSDGTGALALGAGAMVVTEAKPGYGRACLGAIAALPTVDVLVFVDGDYSVFPEQCERLLQAIVDGHDLVLGARSLGTAQPGALTIPQIFGNRFAVLLIRLIWGARFTDLGPFRAIRTDAYRALKMQDETFGWTVEMQVKAVQAGLRWIEVPVDTRVRLGHSKISGTFKGVVGAGCGILGMVWRLWRRERRAQKELCLAEKVLDSSII